MKLNAYELRQESEKTITGLATLRRWAVVACDGFFFSPDFVATLYRSKECVPLCAKEEKKKGSRKGTRAM